MLPAIAFAMIASTCHDLWQEEVYEYVHLRCISSASNQSEQRRLRESIQKLEGNDPRLAISIRDTELFPLSTFEVESKFRFVKVIAGRGRCTRDEIRGQFRSMLPEKPPADQSVAPFAHRISTHIWPRMESRMFCDPWIEADEEGYFWVRRGALVGRAGPDEWGVVTERRELARLTPFPDMCLPFGDNVNLAQPRPTKRESEEWGRGMAVAINEGDLGKRRKHLLRYSTSDNELLASWAVHSLTRLPADPSTAAAVRELLDDAAISPLVVITADRLLCAYQPDSWPSSADRVNVLVKTLQRTRLTERQMLELVYFVKTELSDPVLMEVYRNAYKLSEKEFWKRPTLVKCIDVLGKLPPRGVRSKVQPEPEEELVAAGKFFKALCSQEYPPLVRLRAEKRLTDPEFQR